MRILATTEGFVRTADFTPLLSRYASLPKCFRDLLAGPLNVQVGSGGQPSAVRWVEGRALETMDLADGKAQPIRAELVAAISLAGQLVEELQLAARKSGSPRSDLIRREFGNATLTAGDSIVLRDLVDLTRRALQLGVQTGVLRAATIGGVERLVDWGILDLGYDVPEFLVQAGNPNPEPGGVQGASGEAALSSSDPDLADSPIVGEPLAPEVSEGESPQHADGARQESTAASGGIAGPNEWMPDAELAPEVDEVPIGRPVTSRVSDPDTVRIRRRPVILKLERLEGHRGVLEKRLAELRVSGAGYADAERLRSELVRLRDRCERIQDQDGDHLSLDELEQLQETERRCTLAIAECDARTVAVKTPEPPRRWFRPRGLGDGCLSCWVLSLVALALFLVVLLLALLHHALCCSGGVA